jgi:alkylation response protein AidB-like acyl-CoA dehydrogenase
VARAPTAYGRLPHSTDPGTPSDRALSVITVLRPTRGFIYDGAIDTLGHRGHLTPTFRFDNVQVLRANLLGQIGGGQALIEGSFTGTAARPDLNLPTRRHAAQADGQQAEQQDQALADAGLVIGDDDAQWRLGRVAHRGTRAVIWVGTWREPVAFVDDQSKNSS